MSRRKDGQPRSIPGGIFDDFPRVVTAKLDPTPWVCSMHPEERWELQMTSCDWDPREGYEQDEERYPSVVRPQRVCDDG